MDHAILFLREHAADLWDEIVLARLRDSLHSREPHPRLGILRDRQRCERHQAKLEAVEQEPGKPGAQDEQSRTHSETRLRLAATRTLMMALLSSSP